MTAKCGLCIAYAWIRKGKIFDRSLFVPQTTRINACILLLFFCQLRQLDETYQPIHNAVENQQTRQKTFLILSARLLFMDGVIHSHLLLCLSISMTLAGCGLRDAHHRSTRAVKKHPNYSFHYPGDQGVDQHCE